PSPRKRGEGRTRSPPVSDASIITARVARWRDWFRAGPLWWGIVLALGLAALVRQYLFAHSYWYDEAFLILTVRERGYAELLGPQPYNLVIPPVFLWIVRALYELGGDGELVLRLPA